MTAKSQYIDEIKTHRKSRGINRGRGRKLTEGGTIIHEPVAINADSSILSDKAIHRRALHGEVFQILVTLVMQDGPFLILRLYLIVEFNVVSEMHIFFTCKNAIVSILLVYRLCILTCRGEDHEDDFYHEDATWRLNNVQLAVLSSFIESEQTNKLYVR